MATRDVRSLLDQVIAERRWTTDECVRHFADAAIALGEPATLSAAQLKRWRRGRLKDLPRPTACRVAEQLFGHPIEALLAPLPSDDPSVEGEPLDSQPSQPAAQPAAQSARQPQSAQSARQPQSAQSARQQRRPSVGDPVGGPRPASPWHSVPTRPFAVSDPAASASGFPDRSPGPSAASPFDVELDPIMSAAHDASEHAADAGRAIEDTTLEHLHSEVARLANGYAAMPPMLMFAQLGRARDLAYRMLERTKRPHQLSDLYLIAGQLSGLMSGASFDLGQSDAATEQARAALTYGQITEHPTLSAWARATLSTIALWSGRPREGVTHAQAGLDLVSTGDIAVRLNSLAARCWALAGSPEDAVRSSHAADHARDHDSGTDPFATEIGGEFRFVPARQALCLGATHLAMNDPDGAAQLTQSALDLFAAGPSELRSVGGIHGARLDLASARAMGDDLDAVAEAIAPTLELEPEHRTLRLATRLNRLRSQLGSARFHGSPQADRLAESIEGFLATATSRQVLP